MSVAAGSAGPRVRTRDICDEPVAVEAAVDFSEHAQLFGHRATAPGRSVNRMPECVRIDLRRLAVSRPCDRVAGRRSWPGRPEMPPSARIRDRAPSCSTSRVSIAASRLTLCDPSASARRRRKRQTAEATIPSRIGGSHREKLTSCDQPNVWREPGNRHGLVNGGCSTRAECPEYQRAVRVSADTDTDASASGKERM